MRNGPYILVVAPTGYPGKLYRGRYAYEHHIVWWQATGQIVPDGHVVHHVNEDKTGNRIENLSMLAAGAHASHHSTAERLELTCARCNTQFSLVPSKAKTRSSRNKSGRLFCSKECSNGGQLRPTLTDDQIPHGTSVGYRYHKCKCTVCKTAHNTRIREYKARCRLSGLDVK